MILTKSIHEPIEPEHDGLRILVARFRGHGVPKDAYNVWMANLGPSEQLLRAFQHGEIDWNAFRASYKKEMLEDLPGDERNHTIKNHGQKFTLRLLQELSQRGKITVLCHCAPDQTHCHRHVLKEMLEGKI